jgi:hypothetical protein
MRPRGGKRVWPIGVVNEALAGPVDCLSCCERFATIALWGAHSPCPGLLVTVRDGYQVRPPLRLVKKVS